MKEVLVAALLLAASCRAQDPELPTGIYGGNMNCYQVLGMDRESPRQDTACCPTTTTRSV